ncbi:phosphate ABC transporter substrate-binding protein PstS [Limnochorda pilosa]|uniref:Phosphate-binding protein n=1 Tax=Limnochorda pilosa TaxID=1555112 RepID=A0A0K2SPV9_LIMPI|nr:phosphate ABC transporter substrate-binding protein PstS [Limnochorda pilosa]BAS28869.1 phosphate ABC transporter substrate-binding protein [Limnochorda pilosa]
MKSPRRILGAMLVGALVLTPLAASAQTLQLNGAGATFPYPIYSLWFDTYRSVKSGVQINYQAIGSGGGIRQITAQTVDFGGSDAALSDEQLAAAPGELLHIPTVIGSVAVVYNLQGVDTGLKLSPEVLADIYLGKVTRWNDESIAQLNPSVKLPDLAIAVARRSDGSGTTNIFTNYLSEISAEWKEKVGAGTSVAWPVGLGGQGNAGVAGLVRQIPGAIGYVEIAYALQNKMSYAALQNQSGRFVLPSLEATSLAANKPMPEDLRAIIVNTPDPNGYPIAGFTWLLVYKEQEDAKKGQALVDFLWWAVHDGQKLARQLEYAPLPANVVKMVEEKIASITYDGQPLLKR